MLIKMYLLKVMIIITAMRLGLCSRHGEVGNAAIRACIDIFERTVTTKTSRYVLCGLGEPSGGQDVGLGRDGNRTVVRLRTWTSDAERCAETGRSLGSPLVNFQTAVHMYNCVIQFKGDTGGLPSISPTTENSAVKTTDKHSDPICSKVKPFPKGLRMCPEKIRKACRWGEIQKYVRRLLSQTCTVHIRHMAVTFAAEFKKREMFNLLVDGGADLCTTTRGGKNILHCAVQGGDVGIVKSVIERRLFDINTKTGIYSENSLYLAAQYGHHEVFLLLLQHGADYTEMGRGGKNLLHVACSRKGNVAMVKHILGMNIPGVTMETTDGQGFTPVMVAAKTCNKDIVDLLKNRGCNMKPAQKSLRRCPKKWKH